MKSWRRLAALAGVLAAAALAAVVPGSPTYALFTDQTSAGSNDFTAEPDWTPPSVSDAVALKSTGGDSGFIRPGQGYRVYASATDGGNPASGIATVSANAGLGVVPLVSTGGPWTFGGKTYNYRSAIQTVPAVPDGTYPFTVTATDLDVPPNSDTLSGFSVTIDGTRPSPADIQTANGGSIAGRAEMGDTVTFTWTEPVEPNSILAGWDGSPTDVVVRLRNASPDQLQVWNAANSAQLPLTDATGLNLGRTDYVSRDRTFGATGTRSTMERIGSSIRVTLGTQSGPATTAAWNGTMVWDASATVTDLAGNPSTTSTLNEPAPADKEF